MYDEAHAAHLYHSGRLQDVVLDASIRMSIRAAVGVAAHSLHELHMKKQ